MTTTSPGEQPPDSLTEERLVALAKLPLDEVQQMVRRGELSSVDFACVMAENYYTTDRVVASLEKFLAEKQAAEKQDDVPATGLPVEPHVDDPE